MPPKKARIKDIALLAGVSIGTVDRVLHERGEVAERTREKVMRIARELDYSPNFIARALKTSKRLNIVSLLPEATEDNLFWIRHPQGMERAVNELEPFPVNLIQVTFDLLDENDFQKKTIKVLNLHPDGIILAPIFKTESISFCEKLTKRKIPFVFVDGFIKETKFLAYIGEDIFHSGRVAGQLADMITPAGKDILVVNLARNIQNVHHLNNRTQGFLSYFPESGKNRGNKLNISIPNTEPETIKTEMDRVFTQNPEIGAIFITGSKSYKIADYITNKGLKSVNIIGYDLLEKNIAYLKSGIIKFLIGQRPEEQTYQGVKKLFEFLTQSKIPERIEYLPVDVVTSENVKFFL
ncbi:MAG: LacI family DNA-binding transcriptional regulator [Bacteroidales bacterium]|nr:LacI family DNA-binding transcriptional regulator [Bacteroidales bacterium]